MATASVMAPPKAMSDVRPVRRSSRLLPPGWSLSWLLIGYPLWWALGVTEIVSLAAAGVMAVELLQRRDIRLPVGFGLWMLFLAWVVAGALVVQIDPPGAVAGDSPTRYLTGAFRLAWYLRATIVLLYVINLRRDLGTRWVTRTFSWMFVTITAGGLLGTLLPGISFPSVLELGLPSGVRSIPFIRSMIHPFVSEQQNNISSTLRPSAPFPYANEWGFNFACFLPFFLVAWCSRDSGWRRIAAPFVVAAAVVPVIFSLNRGLWLALLAAAVFVVIRSMQFGHFRLLGGLLGGLVLLAVVIFSTSLGSTVSTRLANGNSDEGRLHLAVLGLQTMSRTSPIVGLGTTRQVQGGFESIAQGATPSCPRCTPPSLGTQGQLSLVAFCQGIGGFLLYFGFFILQFLRHISIRTPTATVGLSLITIHLVTSPVYGADNLGLVAVMAGVALLCREDLRLSRPLPTLGAYGQLLRRYVWLVVACMLAGLGAGLLVQAQVGTTAIAKVSILVPEQPSSLGDVASQTLDTEAQLATDAAARAAAGRSSGGGAGTGTGDLTITATPNSRILNLTYSTLAGPAAAQRAVSAAAASALDARKTSLENQRAEALSSLGARAVALSAAITDIDRTQDRERARSTPGRRYRESAALSETRYRLLNEAGTVSSQISRVTSLPVEVGQTLGPPEVRQTHDEWLVSAANGLMLGLVAGLLFALGREALSPRVPRRGRRRSEADGSPVREYAKVGFSAPAPSADRRRTR